MIVLFDDKKKCCGCSACMNVCPKKAIKMKRDTEGFVYPKIDERLCVECGACKKICSYQNDEETCIPKKVYVAASRNEGLLMQSASGGIFSTMAAYIIENGGVVFGATMVREDEKFVVRHIGVSSMDELPQLLGSKYVQSQTGNCYQEVKQLLKNGRRVLFSGTPCQCAGLRSFLRTNYENLMIVDIICHGVPNQKFFNDYIDYNYGKLEDIYRYIFRDKTRGWEMTARLDFKGGSKLIPGRTTSYFTLFLDGHTYRVNCYSCKYASNHRVGDITIGDFWGIQKEHPELIHSGKYSSLKGISCIIVNTTVGQQMVDEMGKLFELNESTYDKAARRNEQLKEPSKEGRYRKAVMELYAKEGYASVERFYRRVYRKQIIIHSVFNMMPYFVKEMIRKRR